MNPGRTRHGESGVCWFSWLYVPAIRQYAGQVNDWVTNPGQLRQGDGRGCNPKLKRHDPMAPRSRSKTLSFRSRWVLILIILLSCQLFAQRDITGRTWTRWEEGRKIAYLAGFYAGLKADAVVFGQAERDHPLRKPVERNPASVDRYKVERREFYASKLKYNFNMIRQLLDVFYTDPDNLLIPVPEAIRIIALREDGNRERADFLLLRERRKALEGK